MRTFILLLAGLASAVVGAEERKSNRLNPWDDRAGQRVVFKTGDTAPSRVGRITGWGKTLADGVPRTVLIDDKPFPSPLWVDTVKEIPATVMLEYWHSEDFVRLVTLDHQWVADERGLVDIEAIKAEVRARKNAGQLWRVDLLGTAESPVDSIHGRVFLREDPPDVEVTGNLGEGGPVPTGKFVGRFLVK
jgi:hypothetical protein